MRKIQKQNGISFLWESNNIQDMANTTNAVYMLTFPNGSLYVGSCMNLASRIFNHCDSHNSRHDGLRLLRAINKFKQFKVGLVESCQTIEQARKKEKMLIKAIADDISNKIGKESVKTLMLNTRIYR